MLALAPIVCHREDEGEMDLNLYQHSLHEESTECYVTQLQG